jgi:hypothetical protein
MGESRVEKLSDIHPTLDGHHEKEATDGAAASGLRKFYSWPLIRPLHLVACGILDTVNSSVDAMRGRYDR